MVAAANKPAAPASDGVEALTDPNFFKPNAAELREATNRDAVEPRSLRFGT